MIRFPLLGGSVLLLSAALTFVACGDNAANPCTIIPTPASCNLTCDPAGANTCPPGMSCDAGGMCYAQCTPGGAECGDGNLCNDDGRCVPENPPPPPPPPECPRVDFTAKLITPSILLLIDRSDSMLDAFGNTTRWRAVRDALTAPMTGVVTTLQSKAYFGSMIYFTSDNSDTCPVLITRPRALDNAAAIAMDLQQDPIREAWTPTRKSIDAAVASFAAAPAPADSPKFIVLATDGNPSGDGDNCKTYGTPAERTGTIAAAQAAFAANIRLFVLSVAEAADAQYVQELANAGAGVQAGQPNAPVFVGNDPAQLTTSFNTIIRGVVTCDVTITGSVTQEQAGQAVVRLNGRTLTFGTDWVLIGDRTLRLQGQACTDFKNAETPMVNGDFPCGTVIE